MITTTPQVWIGCLAAYNEGHLHGKWVAATDVDVLHDALADVIKTSPALLPEEWYIGDYDGFGQGGSMLGEYADLGEVAAVGKMIDEYGEEFIAYLAVKDTPGEAVETFNEARCGAFDSMQDFAYDWHDSVGDLPPEQWESYIDWERVAREFESDFTLRDGYVFRTTL